MIEDTLIRLLRRSKERRLRLRALRKGDCGNGRHSFELKYHPYRLSCNRCPYEHVIYP